MKNVRVVACGVGSLVLVSAAVLTASRIAPFSTPGARASESSVAEERPSSSETAPPERSAVRLRLELRSKREQGRLVPTAWDGKVTVEGGKLGTVRLWQDDPRHTVDGDRWTLTTRRAIPWNSQQRQRGHEAMPLQDAALIVELRESGVDTKLTFTTQQGTFSVRVGDVPFGVSRVFLSGLVTVARVAVTTTIYSAPTEDDFPAAALGADGTVHVAFTAFTHGEGFRVRAPVLEPPSRFDRLVTPAGGDQVLLMSLERGRWRGPLSVTHPGQDVYRTAVAVDRRQAVWVFWSAQVEGNWDIYARALHEGSWSRVKRLTTDPGPDAFPVATSDSSGTVWLAWQAFREQGHFDILAARENDSGGFSDPITVAGSPANEWTPAIAASRDGRVAFSWDTYERGNYDVLARVWKDGKLGKPIRVATSRRAEMRPSIAYDGADRLWVAYEDAPERWGKDWGALEKDGVALYQDRSVAVRVWDGGRLWETVGDPGDVFLARAPRARARQRRGARLALPRLTADAGGRIWLAVRSPRLGTRTKVGSVWFEHLTWYEEKEWAHEVICPATDNVLDNRPALVALPSGEVLVIASSDGRFVTAGSLPAWFVREIRKRGESVRDVEQSSRWPDPVNNELVAAVVRPDREGPPKPPELRAATLPQPEEPDHGATKERADVARARAARVTVGGDTLRLWRGEFHRHTELSQDGGGDGLLLDMWRYGLDAASLDWIGNGDHDNGVGREYSWWITQKTTDLFCYEGTFTPVFSYERSCSYPDGHRNVVFARRGVRTLPRLRGGMGKALDDLGEDAERPSTPDTQMLYRYLARFDGVCASHTSGTNMGTDWRDNDPRVEPIVEIYQGCRQSYEMPEAPRSNSESHSIGGWRPLGFVSRALKKGFRLGFQASSDHVSTHISYCNVWVETPTREGILEAMKARHVYGATDNIIAEFRSGEHFMGDAFEVANPPRLRVRLTGTAPFSKVHVVKDGNHVYATEPGRDHVDFEWTDTAASPGRMSYYYVRGEQKDGELVWVSPMWITYQPSRADF